MERKTIKFFSYILAMCMIFSSCYYDVEADLYPELSCVTTDMSFSKDIEPLINTNCNGCHSIAANQGNVMLEGYDNAKKYVDNEGLLGSISHKSGYSPMPKSGAKLSDCNISKIQAWITQGSKNN
jgi:hypothetical protein